MFTTKPERASGQWIAGDHSGKMARSRIAIVWTFYVHTILCPHGQTIRIITFANNKKPNEYATKRI